MRRLAASLAMAMLLCLPPAHAAEGVQPVRMREAAVPEYPPAAQRNEVEGTVHVHVRVQPTGQPDDVRIVRSSGDRDLDRAALEAARRSSFVPAQDAAGAAVGATVVIPYKFVLQD